jgi:hypothetical protein
MKKKAVIIGCIALFLPLISNIGAVRCQDESSLAKQRYPSTYVEKMTKRATEDNVKDDKNLGVEILGWIIQHNLFCQYQQIDTEELQERVEKGR